MIDFNFKERKTTIQNLNKIKNFASVCKIFLVKSRLCHEKTRRVEKEWVGTATNSS